MPDLVQCYNKGCGLKFDPAKNTDTSCQYHPGVPVFHDALKGWSCCKKRSTDFSEFLKFPGCTTGRCSNEKPVQVVKPTKQVIDDDIVKIKTPSPTPIVPEERPSQDTPMVPLNTKTAKSYNQAKAEGNKKEQTSDEIKEGASCVHKGCNKTYSLNCDTSDCWYHPGIAVFHEGMKYWSCCKRKTSDFNNFLNQPGCTKGECDFTPVKSDVTKCRYDWHQTSKFVNVSIFAKCANVLTSSFSSNPVVVDCCINFQGDKQYNLKVNLTGVIDVDNSFVTISGTKVELSLRKKTAMTWSSLGEEIESQQPKVDELPTNDTAADVVIPPPCEDPTARLELDDLNYTSYMDRPVKKDEADGKGWQWRDRGADEASDHSSLSGIDDTEWA